MRQQLIVRITVLSKLKAKQVSNLVLTSGCILGKVSSSLFLTLAPFSISSFLGKHEQGSSDHAPGSLAINQQEADLKVKVKQVPSLNLSGGIKAGLLGDEQGGGGAVSEGVCLSGHL